MLSATNHGQSHGEHEGNVELPWGEVRVYVNSVLIAKSSKQFQDYDLAADFPEAPIQNKIEIALFGTQFACFTGTKVQILTQKALPDLTSSPPAEVDRVESMFWVNASFIIQSMRKLSHLSSYLY